MSPPAPVGSRQAERLARAAKPAEEALRLHTLCRGKMQTLPRCPIRGFDDFAVWYSDHVIE